MTTPATSSNRAISPIPRLTSVRWPTTVDRPKRTCRRPAARPSTSACRCLPHHRPARHQPATGRSLRHRSCRSVGRRATALCVNGYTGAVSSPERSCATRPAETRPIPPAPSASTPTPVGSRSSEQASARRSSETHLMPDDGALLTCVSRYTGANRAVADHSQCLVYELPNIIPAAA